MSKRRPKRTKPQMQAQTATGTKTEFSPLAILLAIATLIGGLVALVTLLPRVSPSISDPHNPSDPFSSLITVTNTGYIPLRSVTISIGLKHLATSRGVTIEAYGNGDYAYMAPPQWKPRYLGLDDRFTILLNDFFINGYTEGELAVVIDYQIPIIHWKRRKVFPILSKRRSDGTLYWEFEAATD